MTNQEVREKIASLNLSEAERKHLYTFFICAIVDAQHRVYSIQEPLTNETLSIIAAKARSYMLARQINEKQVDAIKIINQSKVMTEFYKLNTSLLVIIIDLVDFLIGSKVKPFTFTKSFIKLFDSYTEELQNAMNEAGLDGEDYDKAIEAKEFAKEIWEKLKYFLDVSGKV